MALKRNQDAIRKKYLGKHFHHNGRDTSTPPSNRRTKQKYPVPAKLHACQIGGKPYDYRYNRIRYMKQPIPSTSSISSTPALPASKREP